MNPCFIHERDLRISRRLMRKKMKSYRDEIRVSSDDEFREAKKRNLAKLKRIVDDMNLIIDSLQVD